MNPGPCAKQTVVATLIDPRGEVFEGTNWCLNAQKVCPRDAAGYKSGEGYHLCKEVCRQVGHAEENAIYAARNSGKARLSGARLYVSGHTYACGNCKDTARRYGVEIIITGSRNESHPSVSR